MLVDIPKDVLQAATTFSWPSPTHLLGYRPTTAHAKQIRAAAAQINSAAAPVLYVGAIVVRAVAT